MVIRVTNPQLPRNTSTIFKVPCTVLEISAVSQLERVLKSSTSSHASTKGSGIQEPESDPLNLIGYAYEILVFLTGFKLCFYKFKHIISQTKHAKSYNYLMQNISIVLFCAAIFECLLYYFRYKVLSKTICFHPFIYPRQLYKIPY